MDLLIGNTSLIDHGITTERSDLRAHVCVNAGKVYVFSTAKAVQVIEQGNYKLRTVVTERDGLSFVTAEGYAVPVADLGPKELHFPRLIENAKFRFDAKTSDKGNRAVWVVEQLLKHGEVPIPFDSQFVTDVEVQKQGFDLVVRAKFRIEVKCDYKGGLPYVQGKTTGNLFLQVAECNPFKQW